MKIINCLKLLSSNNSQFRKNPATSTRNKFCATVRQEIGIYARQHGTAAAVRHFSDKLQLHVKDSTVRKFKKAAISNSLNSSNQQHPQPQEPDPILSSPPPPVVAPEPVLEQAPESTYYNQIPGSYNHFPASQSHFVYQPVNNYHNNHQNVYGMTQQSISSYPNYNTLHPPQQYQSPMVQMPGYSRIAGNWNDECQDISTSSNDLIPMQHQNTFNYHSTMQQHQQRHGMITGPSSSIIREQQPSLCLPGTSSIPPPLELNLPNNEMVSQVSRSVNHRKSTKKNSARAATQRGSYATYTPEFRREVGMFAAQHGCPEAAQHFKVFLLD